MIGVLIKISDKPLFTEKIKRIVVDNKFKHYDISMVDFRFCPQCGSSLEAKTKEETYYISEIKEFIKPEIYEFKPEDKNEDIEKYSVERDYDTHRRSTKYFIYVQTIFNKDHDLKFGSKFYIKALQIANQIGEKLRKAGFDAYDGIIDFQNHNTEIEF